LFYKGKKMDGPSSSGTDLHGFGESVRTELEKRLPRSDVKALDVGTGFATNVRFLARVLSQGSLVWTLDPSAEVLNRARKLLKEDGLDRRVRFVRCGIEHVDVKDGFFDLVSSTMALHHLSDLHVAVAEMSRILTPGGKILIADFGPESAQELRFGHLHGAADFFDGEAVRAALRGRVTSLRKTGFGLWYLVEGTK